MSAQWSVCILKVSVQQCGNLQYCSTRCTPCLKRRENAFFAFFCNFKTNTRLKETWLVNAQFTCKYSSTNTTSDDATACQCSCRQHLRTIIVEQVNEHSLLEAIQQCATHHIFIDNELAIGTAYGLHCMLFTV